MLHTLFYGRLAEPDEDFDEETLSPTKFKEDLCSKKVSPTKSIFESKIFLSPKIASSVQLQPEKILCLQELPLSPVKEVSEIETKETCTSPCSDKLETVKPNQLISTRKGFRTRKRLSPIHDGGKLEQKLPSRVDKGLSPIAVLTAGPSGIEKEGSEYFVQTYDAPAMQEPIESSVMFCSKSTEMSPKSIFENRNVSRISISQNVQRVEKHVSTKLEEKIESTVINVETSVTGKPVIDSIEEKQVTVISTVPSDLKQEDHVVVKVEKSTSPLSDIMLDTGIGTESPVTADTASSPFMPDTLSPSSLSIQSSAQLKENSSTQTIHVEMLSAHTSPIDGPFSLQESNISCCGTESSLKSDSLDDISRTLGTPSSDNVEIDVGPEMHYSLSQSQSKDLTKSTVKEFLEEHTVSDNASDVMEAEDISTSSSHEIFSKTDLPGYIEDSEAVNKLLVIESFRNAFATEPPFSVVATQQRASPKKHVEYKKTKKLILSDASSEDKIFSLHDQLLSEESALESSTDSGVDLKESNQTFVTYTTTVQTAVHLDKKDIKKPTHDSISDIYDLDKAKENLSCQKITSKSVEYKIQQIPVERSINLDSEDSEVKIVEETCIEKKIEPSLVKMQHDKDLVLTSHIIQSDGTETKIMSTKERKDGDIPDYVKKVEEQVLSATAAHIIISPKKEINTLYVQQIFKPVSEESSDQVSQISDDENIILKPVEEKTIVATKATLSFDSETEQTADKLDSITINRDKEKIPMYVQEVEQEIVTASNTKEFTVPSMEVDVVDMQEIFESVVAKEDSPLVPLVDEIMSTKPVEEMPVVQVKASISSDCRTDFKTITEEETEKEKDPKSIPDYVKEVEKETLSTNDYQISVSPTKEINAIYVQEIFEPSCVEITSTSIKSDDSFGVDADSKPVEEEIIKPTKTSLSFDSDVGQDALELRSETVVCKETDSSYISDKETFSDAVDRIFSTVEIDSDVSKVRPITDSKIFVAEATVIKDKRDSLYLSDPEKLSPKLEQSTSTDATIEGKIIFVSINIIFNGVKANSVQIKGEILFLQYYIFF